MAVIAYRKDIDGLRAIAVLSVILYHTFASWLPGGYLGVDIFFVLSGFLITSIIQSDLNRDRFSIWRFYERRIRRIMPALLAMLLVVSIVSVVVLLPADLIGFAKSSFATLTFSANIYFWLDTSYFARAAEEKPLLHIWSLGVEEQFYLLFPLVLWLVSRFWKRATLIIIVLLTVMSFAFNILLNKVGGANPAFFLIPSRAWELGAGAILAVLPVGLAPKRKLAEILAIAGLGLIAFALWRAGAVYNTIPAALPAVLGACLLVFAANVEVPMVSQFLARQPVVFIGQISYSLYLWHWPVLVFLRYYLVRELSVMEAALAFLLMLILAVVSWRWIERPFRNGTLDLRRVLGLTGVGSVAAATIATVVLLADGLPGRLPADAAQINAAVGTNFRCAVTDYKSFGKSRACVLNLPTGDVQDAELVVFGNSHAQMYAPYVADMARDQHVSALLVPMNGCLPTLKVNTGVDCLAMAQGNLDAILELPKVKLVVIGLNWPTSAKDLVNPDGSVITDPADKALIAALDDVIARIKATGRNVVLIGPIEIPGWDIASTLSRERAFGWPQSHPDHVPAKIFTDLHHAEIAHFSSSLGENFLRPDKVLCDQESCRFVIDGTSMFADSNHIAKAALPRFKDVFAPLVKAMQALK